MPSTRPPVCEPLLFPLPSQPSRIAIIGGRFSEAKNIRDFDPADINSLAVWQPQALVAPIGDALALAEFAPPLQLSAAVVVLTSLGGDRLDDNARDRLWDAFGVPVFEQLRCWDGVVIARECEAHAGLHIAPDSVILDRDAEGEILLTLLQSKRPAFKSRTGLLGEIVDCECECGSGIPRLQNLVPVCELVPEPEPAGD